MSDEPIRSVVRALAVLQTMNTAQRWTLHDLHLALHLPKSTLFRILATLAHEGYVRADVAAGYYMLTTGVKRLSDGVAEQSNVVAVGSPIVIRVTKEIKWPLAIGVICGDVVEVGFSTMPYSPLAVRTTTVGRRLSLIDSAMGMTYLAHCSDDERDSLLYLRGEDTLDEGAIRRGLAQVASVGYAIRRPGRGSDSATLAIPICGQAHVLGVLGMTTFGRTMTEKFVSQHLPVMRKTALEISHAYDKAVASAS